MEYRGAGRHHCIPMPETPQPRRTAASLALGLTAAVVIGVYLMAPEEDPDRRRLVVNLIDAVAKGGGFMVGIELEGFPLSARAGHQVTLAARRRGAIVRPLGDVVVLMPPLAISRAELKRLLAIVRESIAEVVEAAAPAESRLAA